MAAEAEILKDIFTVIEGGKVVADTAKIIPFPADNGTIIAEGISEVVTSGNGVANTVNAITTTTAEGAKVTTGLGLLAVDVGLAGAAIAPLLGVAAGVALYNLSPEFWTKVNQTLVNAGKTIGGKVISFIDSVTGNSSYDEETINIFKDAFIEEGLFNTNYLPNSAFDPATDMVLSNYPLAYFGDSISAAKIAVTKLMQMMLDNNHSLQSSNITTLKAAYEQAMIALTLAPEMEECGIVDAYIQDGVSSTTLIIERIPITKLKNLTSNLIGSLDGKTKYMFTEKLYDYWNLSSGWVTSSANYNIYRTSVPLKTLVYDNSIISASYIHFLSVYDHRFYLNRTYRYHYTLIASLMTESKQFQDNAILPNVNESISITYPDYAPTVVPEGLPNMYPAPLPNTVTPSTSQDEAQNPDNSSRLEELLEFLIENLPLPEPNPDPVPDIDPAPDLDPDPQPEPLPDIEPSTPNVPSDPIDPNPTPPSGGLPFLPVIPPTTSSNKLFTVYNPTIDDINMLGDFLWSDDILTELVKMWQNPLDGIISLSKVYCNPVCGAEKNIKLGKITTNIMANVLTEQFVTVNCGTISIKEDKRNATDYSPYSSISIYLPFIGIHELDVDELMNSQLEVKYHVDMYTGTCLAELYVTREPDMSEPKLLYTFNGNCSQQIPLTSSNALGLYSFLGSIALTVASGGSLGVAGAVGASQTIVHDMIHVQHSGSLSANAGIMGQRKPFVIIGKRHCYDANGYNELYGFPCNKTVYLGNCKGYTKIKSLRLQSKATQEEKLEIEELLMSGVIL